MEINDNNNILLYCSLGSSNIRKDIINKAKEISQEQYNFNFDKINYNKTTNHTEYSFSYKNSNYYGSSATIPKDDSFVTAIIVHPLDNFETKLTIQRISFFLLDLASTCILFTFSWFFTKKILKPIEENRKRQLQFVASASHELRSPLTVIMSNSSALNSLVNEENTTFLETISSEGRRMSKLINDLLVLANSDNASWSMNFKLEDIDTIVLNVYEAYIPLIKDKNIKLSINLPENSLIKCNCDKERIYQLLSILLDNAISYTNSNGKIVLSLDQNKKYVILKVIDTGIGISNEDKEHIFERFYRADNSRTDKNHFGLGLSIAYEIIKLHKGIINVYDTVGGGSTFVIRIPIGIYDSQFTMHN
ncbi:HAMP domain-containing sensor histidine kinase [uncultured Clostridium sp.]|uniref:sensor histidine kinase n=1 Tax=uncultured Clostridium sp. TaxID=59620 RepID=UPI0025D80638|nr:HAMP domain-containing sensor histidine kinase [uncultured Clostridium sp.]